MQDTVLSGLSWRHSTLSRFRSKTTSCLKLSRAETDADDDDHGNARMHGLGGAVRAKRAPIEGISFVRFDGRLYGVIESTGNPEQQALISEYKIFRGDLAQILYYMTRDNHTLCLWRPNCFDAKARQGRMGG